MASVTTAIKALSISVSLIVSGGIAAISLFDVPELQSSPASHSLPSIRWLFSRGSHIFPQASIISTAGFAYLAYDALPQGRPMITQVLCFSGPALKANGYLAAAALALSIGPFTAYMIPTNFALIEMNEEKGGARSERSAQEHGTQGRSGKRSARDSVNGEGGAAEFTDLSGPQRGADVETTDADDKKANELLARFGMLNGVRALLIGTGGIVGLVTALM